MSRGLVLTLGALLLSRLALGGAVGLSPVEAYYWTWSRRPDWGYLDHGPMVAWLIRAATAPLGDGAWAVRLPSALLFVATLALLAALARDLGGPRAALPAVLLALATPVLHAGGFAANPDVPLAFFAVGYLLALRRGRLLLAGAALGLACLCKATAVALAPVLFVVAGRRAAPAALLAAALASPYLLWNAARGFPSLALQLVERDGAAWWTPLAFLGGQLAYVTPPLLWVFAGALRADRFARWAAAPTLALAAALSLGYRSAEPHWTAVAWLPLAAAAAAVRPPSRRQTAAIAAVSLPALAALYLMTFTPWIARVHPEPRWDLTNELHGGPELARAIGARLPAAAHWTVCAPLAHAAGGEVWCGRARKTSQFDLWPRPDPRGRAVALIGDHRFAPPDGAARGCPAVVGEPDVVVRRGGRVVRRFRVARCVPGPARVAAGQ